MSKVKVSKIKISKNKNVESKCRKLEYEYVSGLEINVWKIVQYFGWQKWESGWCHCNKNKNGADLLKGLSYLVAKKTK